MQKWPWIGYTTMEVEGGGEGLGVRRAWMGGLCVIISLNSVKDIIIT